MEMKQADLRAAVTAAKNGLGHALRALIASGVPDGQPDRNAVETDFEAANNCLAGTVESSHLDAATKALAGAIKTMEGVALKYAVDLKAVQEAHAAAVKARGIEDEAQVSTGQAAGGQGGQAGSIGRSATDSTK